MKRIIAVICLSVLLVGCGSHNVELDKAIALRENVISAGKCSFLASVTAEYDDIIHTFDLRCETDRNHEMYFEVVKPDTIAGIAGKIAQSNGMLTFDDEMLAFELLIDGRLSPISSPWLMLKMLRSGYIVACGREGDGVHIQLEDTYNGEKILVDLYTDKNNLPIRADIIWNGKRSLSVVVSDFSIV